MVNHDRYRQLFVAEARDHLRDFNNRLIEFERFQHRADEDGVKARAESLDACFRAAHSLKGMASSLGFESFAGLAHAIEELADQGRRGVSLDDTAIDELLKASDQLRAAVAYIAGEAQTSPSLEASLATLTMLAKGELAAPFRAERSPSTGPLQRVTHRVLLVQLKPSAPLPRARALVLTRTFERLPGFQCVVTPPLTADGRQVRTSELRFRFGLEADPVQIEAAATADSAVLRVSWDPPASVMDSPQTASPSTPGSAEVRSLRASTSRLEGMIDSVGELLLTRSRLRALAGRLDEPALDELVDDLDRLSRELHEHVLSARMAPLASVTDQLPRVVRDMARAAGKQVEFCVDVGDIELDRTVLEELLTPLLHLVRNAIDHAHEGADDRRARGKPSALQLQLSASRDRDRVLLELRDDGVGINPVRLLEVARARGIVGDSPHERWQEGRTMELLFLPGFSTASTVTTTSGRGVGLDAARTTLEQFGGTLHVDSRVGEGASFVLSLPLTVAIVRVLLVRLAPHGDAGIVAIPIHRVQRVIELPQAAPPAPTDEFRVVVDGRSFEKVSLQRWLSPGPQAAKEHVGLLVDVPGGSIVFCAHTIVGQEELVVKPLGAPLSMVPWLAGASLLADGRAAFLVDLRALWLEAIEGEHRRPRLPPRGSSAAGE